jgi:glucose-1-phosphate thymidylyltransferase
VKGIVLAGGIGTRLYPATKAMSKQRVPIYDKPMIYYLLQINLLLIITWQWCLEIIFSMGKAFQSNLRKAATLESGAYIFCYYFQNSKVFGVVEFDDNDNVISLEEKLEKTKYKYAVPGLYFYDNSVVDKAKALKPSLKGELEITDLNKIYMEEGSLR